MRRLDATTLIDSNVHNNSAVGNLFQHVFRDQFGSGSTFYQHGAYDQIRLRDRVLDHVSARGERGDLRKENIVEFAQSIEIVVDDRHVRAHADGDLRGICSDYAAADDEDRKSTRLNS